MIKGVKAALLALFLSLPGCVWHQQLPVAVEIQRTGTGYQLLRDGQPYELRGAGTQLVRDLTSIAAHGGNSVRTWRTYNASELLDRAHDLGLTVALCLDMKRERHGFDYDDAVAVRRQLDFFRGEVLKYRNHPALLAWIIGNELNLEYSNPRVYDAVNDISRMIHELDPNHPTTSTTAGISNELAAVINGRAPDLDFLSVQVYGGLFSLPDALESLEWDRPIMITEWGTIGHWEVDQTPWGAPLELDSHDKAMTYRRGYEEVLASLDGRYIGSYVFLWSFKQERTPTWYGMFTPDGRRTEVVDVMQQLWTGSWPDNRAPILESMTLDDRRARDNVRLHAGERYTARVAANDPEGDTLVYDWQLLGESRATEVGGDAEKAPPDLSGYLLSSAGREITLVAPSEPGAYRLFVYVRDDSGAAHANIPFRIH
ncbi:MAG: hypothetical protein HUJ31_08290 [Pseudomonadales bacterium]|nr:hypothetical protein [Pseudomonadales bacterium]